jgi:hypothetical protein
VAGINAMRVHGIVGIHTHSAGINPRAAAFQGFAVVDEDSGLAEGNQLTADTISLNKIAVGSIKTQVLSMFGKLSPQGRHRLIVHPAHTHRCQLTVVHAHSTRPLAFELKERASILAFKRLPILFEALLGALIHGVRCNRFDEVEVAREGPRRCNNALRCTEDLGRGRVLHGDVDKAFAYVVFAILSENGGKIVCRHLNLVYTKDLRVNLEVGVRPRVGLIDDFAANSGGNITIVLVSSCDAMDCPIPDLIVLVTIDAGFNCCRQCAFPVCRGQSWGNHVVQLNHVIDCLGGVTSAVDCVEAKQVFATLTVVKRPHNLIRHTHASCPWIRL